jgi:hypothetical protein
MDPSWLTVLLVEIIYEIFAVFAILLIAVTFDPSVVLSVDSCVEKMKRLFIIALYVVPLEKLVKLEIVDVTFEPAFRKMLAFVSNITDFVVFAVEIVDRPEFNIPN